MDRAKVAKRWAVFVCNISYTNTSVYRGLNAEAAPIAGRAHRPMHNPEIKERRAPFAAPGFHAARSETGAGGGGCANVSQVSAGMRHVGWSLLSCLGRS